MLPAIHMKKEEIGELFHQQLGTEAGASDPKYLTEAARGHLREKFLAAEAGLTGVNFAVAETGGVVVCTNEGNADLGISLPPVHIACMGVEKLDPAGRRTWASSCGCWRAPPPGSRSPPTPRTSTVPRPGASCTS